MTTRTVHLIAGARPNFMKIAPLFHELAARSAWDTRIVHTGQHYDTNMSSDILDDLRLPVPHVSLDVGSGSHSVQTAKVMTAYEPVALADRPDLDVVVGDVNSTLAATLVAKKLCLRLAHLEAGLRSFDRTMPEEINRLVTDSLSDILWTPSEDADANLRREGVASERICRVGNIMIDSFELLRERIDREDMAAEWGLTPEAFGVATIHRPANVDSEERLRVVVDALGRASRQLPLVFPVHPRTEKRLKALSLWDDLAKNVRLVPPLGYARFMSLVLDARFVLTDSGGLQEETSYLGIPCLTLRKNTERPVTVTQGTNRLVEWEELDAAISDTLGKATRTPTSIDLWDGKAAGRVVESIEGIR